MGCPNSRTLHLNGEQAGAGSTCSACAFLSTLEQIGGNMVDPGSEQTFVAGYTPNAW